MLVQCLNKNILMLISKVLIEKILKAYKLNYIKIYNAATGYRNKCYKIDLNNGGFCNLIIYKPEENILNKIKNGNSISNYLYLCGFPTRYTYRKVRSILKVGNSKNIPLYACLYNYLEGTTIPWDGYTMKHIKILGQMMSNMHNQLLNNEVNKLLATLPDESQILQSQAMIMSSYFERNDVRKAIKKKLYLRINLNLLNFLKLFKKLKHTQWQPIHMDFVRGNILFQRKPELHISGILDFEKVAKGLRLFDIARTLAFLIVDCKYKQEEKIRKYFLFDGYQKRGKLNLPSLKYLDYMVGYFLFYDFYKFLLHNPYEYLHLNEHFVRTQNKLLSMNLLKHII